MKQYLKNIFYLFNRVKDVKESKNKKNKQDDSAQNPSNQQEMEVEQQSQSIQIIQEFTINDKQGEQQFTNQLGNQVTFTNFDNEFAQQRQRNESFNIPNQNSNKNKKNQEIIIPQTPIFLPEKSKRINIPNIQENQAFNGRKQMISSNSNQEFTLNSKNQQQNSLGVHLDIDQQSNEMNMESFLKQNTFKDDASFQDILKAETPEKKRIIQQQRNQIDGGFNNTSFSSSNNRNFSQTIDQNFQNRSVRQNNNQQDKKIRESAPKQNKILKDKELINSSTDQIIRECNWVQPSSKPQKKFLEKREQNLVIPQKGANSINIEQINQKSFNRKRHNIIENFDYQSDSDEVDYDEKDNNSNINKIFEVQKKRMQDRLMKLNKYKELEKKNQLSFTAPYGTNVYQLLAINHREQEKQEYEEQIAEGIKQQNKIQDKPQIKFDITQTQNEKNNFISDSKQSQDVPRKLVDSVKIPDINKIQEPIQQVDLFKNANFSENMPQKSQTVKPFVNIVIPEKINIPQININGESTPLEKSDDILQAPPAPKASIVPSGGLFNIQQKSLDKNQEIKIVGGLQNNIQQPVSIEQQNKQNSQNQQATNVPTKVFTNPVQGNLISNNPKSLIENTQQVGDQFSLNVTQNTQKIPQVQIKQDLQNDINNTQQIIQPKNINLFGNLNQLQNSEYDPIGNTQYFFTKQVATDESNQASVSSQQPPTEGLFSNKGLPPKKKLQSNSDNGIIQNGLFGNQINPTNQKINQNQIHIQESGAPAQNTEPQIQKKVLFSNLSQIQNSIPNELNKNSVQSLNYKPDVQDAPQQKQQIDGVKFEQLDESSKSLPIGNPNQTNIKINNQQQLFDGINQNSTKQGGGLFNSSLNVQEIKPVQNTLLNNNPSLEGGQVTKNDNQISSQPKVGGLFGSIQTINEAPQTQLPQSNQKPCSLFGNLKNAQLQNNFLNQGIPSSQGSLFSKQVNDQQKPDSQSSNSQGGLFEANQNILNKQNNEKPTQVISLFGNQVNVPQTNGGLFNTQPNNQLLDKPKIMEVLPLPSKSTEQNGQLLTQLNSLNNGEKANQGINGGNSQGLFPQSLSEKQANGQSAQTGLFGQKNQPLIQNNSLFTEPKEQKIGLFSNANPSGTGLFGNQNPISSQTLAISTGQNNILGNTQQQGGIGAGLFANLAAQKNIQQNAK